MISMVTMPRLFKDVSPTPCPALSNYFSAFGHVSPLHLPVLYHRYIFNYEITGGFKHTVRNETQVSAKLRVTIIPTVFQDEQGLIWF